MKRIFTFFVTLALFFTSFRASYAANDPLSVPNNRFGIHIFSEKDIPDATKLVNTNGDWGYVTFVITEGERDHDRWQQVFDQMRRLHLIPIVRLATKADGSIWEKPKEEEINNWLAFLNSLNWVTQNRYIVIGNEPNLDNEWGGKSDAGDYALYLKDFSERLKATSGDFFVLPAGLAPNPNELRFIKSMLSSQPAVFDHIDGWASHSYPKETIPSSSIQLYKGELNVVGKNLPVFITETGWPVGKFSDADIGQKLSSAYQNEWNDPKIVAVTPFILDYPQAPFTDLSWKKANGSFYSFYDKVRDTAKVNGEPVQLESGQILAAFAQPVIPAGSDYIGAILAKNTGQSVWSADINTIRTDSNAFVASYSFNDIEPTKLGLIVFKAATPATTGIYSQSLFLTGSKGQRITNSFPTEALIVSIDKSQIQVFFAKIGSYLRSILRF